MTDDHPKTLCFPSCNRVESGCSVNVIVDILRLDLPCLDRTNTELDHSSGGGGGVRGIYRPHLCYLVGSCLWVGGGDWLRLPCSFTRRSFQDSSDALARAVALANLRVGHAFSSNEHPPGCRKGSAGNGSCGREHALWLDAQGGLCLEPCRGKLVRPACHEKAVSANTSTRV